jgi:ABC-type phosphate transport system substrate-binding protein
MSFDLPESIPSSINNCMRRVASTISIAIATAFLLGQPLFGVRISGSDLLGERIEQAIQAELEKAGLEANLSFSGSLHGESALASGYTDACILAVPDGEEVPGNRQYLLGFQVVAFGVHPTNPLQELNYSQLGNIFQENGGINDWVELVSELAWEDRKIDLWASRSDELITLEIFNAVVLKGSALKNSIRYNPADEEQLQRVLEEEPTALVVVPAISLKSSGHLLAIKDDASGQAFTPSEDNVFYGDYPLRLPFHLIVSDSLDTATTEKLVQVIYSDGVTEALEASYYMPVPESEREAILSQVK